MLRGSHRRDGAGIHAAAKIGTDLDITDKLAIDRLAEEIIEFSDSVFLRRRRRRLAEVIIPVAPDLGPSLWIDEHDRCSRQQSDARKDGSVPKEVLERQVLDQCFLVDLAGDGRLR